MEGEYIAAKEAAQESQWIVSFLGELGYSLPCSTLFVDN